MADAIRCADDVNDHLNTSISDQKKMAEPNIRRGLPPVKLSRREFETRYRSRFVDPAFKPLQRELDAIIAAAWDAYSHSRKAPVTRKAGFGFADPIRDRSGLAGGARCGRGGATSP
jgi:hypothetical protein